MVEAETSSSSSPVAAGGEAVTPPPPKKKRSLPGMPDPEAQVVALSPKTLLATNRFVCEICNKGFQRDQNLQLHRRGHNLPWKLKQRGSDEAPRKRVYVCPEPTCVHHSPARALGDLTGIKKHFCRKHGDKKWKCQRCSKRYTVMSDWKAHMRTCGTREYRCDCGTLFSRKDSFITHRAFCVALVEESAMTSRSHNQTPPETVPGKEVEAPVSFSPPPPPLTPSTTVVSPGLSVQSSELAENPMGVSPPTPATTCLTVAPTAATSMSSATSSSNHIPPNVFNSTPATAVLATISQQSHIPSASFSSTMRSLTPVDCPAVMPTPGLAEPPSLSLSSSLYLSDNPSALFLDHRNHHYAPSPQPAMSATTLLQKVAQMGATTSNPSFLHGLGLQVSSSSGQDGNANQWDIKPDSETLASGLGLGLASNNTDVMLSSSFLFGNNKPTLDFLGLGVGASSVLLSSYAGGFNVGATPGPGSYNGGGVGGSSEEIWDGRLPERKPNGNLQMDERQLSPGFTFHPTDVELVMYYLKRKLLGKKFHSDVIREVDIYKFDPWDLPCQSGRETDNRWYFFYPTKTKYAMGRRNYRSTTMGYWKTTGKDKGVSYNQILVGMIKTLVFHKGRPPNGERTDWVMREYRLEYELADKVLDQNAYVLCVLFKKDGKPFREEDWNFEGAGFEPSGSVSIEGDPVAPLCFQTPPSPCSFLTDMCDTVTTGSDPGLIMHEDDFSGMVDIVDFPILDDLSGKEKIKDMEERERRSLINELLMGQGLVRQLQNHLNSTSSSTENTQGMLVQRILDSYREVLSMLKSRSLSGQMEVPSYTGAGEMSELHTSTSATPQSEVDDLEFENEEIKTDGFERKKIIPRWTVKVQTSTEVVPFEDGYNWRKYGQKDMLGAKYPRSYYRCSYRNLQGCLATKQVQRSDDDPMLFEVTYQGRHTCNPPINSPSDLLRPPSPLHFSQVSNTVEPHPCQKHDQQDELHPQEQAFDFFTGRQQSSEDLLTHQEAMHDVLYHGHHLDYVSFTPWLALVVSLFASPLVLSMRLLCLPKLYPLIVVCLTLGGIILSILRFFRTQMNNSVDIGVEEFKSVCKYIFDYEDNTLMRKGSVSETCSLVSNDRISHSLLHMLESLTR